MSGPNDDDPPDSLISDDENADAPDDWLCEADEEPKNIDDPDEWVDFAEGDDEAEDDE